MAGSEREKLLVVGWEGADWNAIQPLMDEGRLPNLARLVDEGVMGKLRSLEPQLTKPLWTSIATGQPADRHGILTELEPDPGGAGVRATGSHTRRRPALWNLCSERGLRSLVVGWPGSHPAEPVEGVLVSELFGHVGGAPPDDWPLARGTVHPVERAEELAELRLHPTDLGTEHLVALVPAAEHLDARHAPALAGIAAMLAETTSVHAAITQLLEHESWDFAAVCYDAIDRFSHAFMPMRPPHMPGVSRQAFDIYRHVVDGIYVYCDLMLGRLLELAGPNANVALVSEHGFHCDHRRPTRETLPPGARSGAGRRSGTEWHRELGILVLRGAGLRRDEWVWGADLTSIAPTCLALLGLPVPSDLPGRPLLEAFQGAPDLETAPPFESGDETEQGEVPGAVEQLTRLVEHGFVEAEQLAAPDAAERARDAVTLHRALVGLQSNRAAEALPLLEDLHRRFPTSRRFLLHLARCREALGETGEARCLLEEFAALGRPNSVSQMMRGRIDLADGRLDDALTHLLEAEQESPDQPALHVQIGEVYMKMERWAEAEQAFRRALALDPDAAEAHLGIARAALESGQNELAAEAALEAIVCRHRYPLAHYLLGVALARLGRADEAVRALETALDQRPELHEADRALAFLHEHVTGDGVRATFHRARSEAGRRAAGAAAEDLRGEPTASKPS